MEGVVATLPGQNNRHVDAQTSDENRNGHARQKHFRRAHKDSM